LLSLTKIHSWKLMIVLIIKKKKNRKHYKQRPACHRDERFIFFQPTVNQSAYVNWTNKSNREKHETGDGQQKPNKRNLWCKHCCNHHHHPIFLFSLCPLLGTTILHFSSQSILPSHLFFIPVKKTKTALKNK